MKKCLTTSAYSQVHFDEMIRSGNIDMLKGIEALGAVPLVSNENGDYDIDSLGVCLDYEDPYAKFDKYKSDNDQAVTEADDLMLELFLRFLGADNYKELQKVPVSIIEVALEAADGELSDGGDLV